MTMLKLCVLLIVKVFMVHHQLKFSSVLALNLCVYMQYTSLSTPLITIAITELSNALISPLAEYRLDDITLTSM